MYNKKGLSGIVTTLIIILLVLVAIGIVWVVIKGVLDTNTDTIGISSKCTLISLKIIGNGTCDETNGCSVLMERDAGGEAFDGVRIIVSNVTGSASSDIPGDIGELAKVTKSASGVNVPTKIIATAYFNDAEGNPELCTTVVDRNI